MESDAEPVRKLVELVRQCSLERLKQLSKDGEITIEEVELEPAVFAHWMSFVLLSGKSLRILFKVHYMSDTAKHFAAKIYGVEKEKVSIGRALDFFREYCNLTAGSLKIALENNAIKVGISLPILAKGFDEVFYLRTSDTETRCWKLVSGEEKIACSTHVTLLEKLSIDKAGLESDVPVGDVEFL